MERIRDLFDPSQDNLQIHEDKSAGIHIAGSTSNIVSSAKEALEHLTKGMLGRATGSTKMNAESSRSHSVVIVQVLPRKLSAVMRGLFFCETV